MQQSFPPAGELKGALLYDPLVGRFLSADNVIQDPTSTQNYNRYSYCLNNPLKFTDPTGYRMAAADQYRDLGEEHFEMRIGNRDSSGNHIFGQSSDNGGADGDYSDYWTSLLSTMQKLPDGVFESDEWTKTHSGDYVFSFMNGFFTSVDGNIIKIEYNNHAGGAQGKGLDGMDYANYLTSFTGTIAGGAQFAVGVAKNQSLWNASHKAFKALKFIGVNVQTRAIKHGAKIALANASRNIVYVGLVLSVGDMAIDGQINASHLLNLGMVGVSAIPVVGWIAGGTYFAADMITLGVSGQSIGQHLDNYVGGHLYDY